MNLVEPTGAVLSGRRIVIAIVILLSISSVIASWACTRPVLQWWREMGYQLPGISESWQSPTWHVVAALVVVGSAFISRIQGFFGIGLGIWGLVFVFVLHLGLIALAIFMPMVRLDGPLGQP